MTNKTSLFLFLAIATILIASPLASENAFAVDKNDGKNDKKDEQKKSSSMFDIVKLLEQILAELQNLSSTSGEVVVTNNVTNPVPVEIQGNVPITGEVTITNNVTIANNDPISVKVDNFPALSSEVTIVNSEPIPVTGISSSPVCPADKVQHWYSMEITQNLSFIELRSPTGPTISENDLYWIQIQHGSDDIINFHDSVIDKLTALGYEAYNLNTQTSSPLLYSFDWIAIQNLQPSSHSTICAE